jgi:hypothetical protein
MGKSNRSGGNSDPVIDVPDAEDEAQLAALKKKIEAAQAKVNEAELQLPNLVASWEAEMESPESEKKEMWESLPITDVKSEGKASPRKLPDGSWIIGGRNPNSDIYSATAPLKEGQLTGLLLHTLPDPSLPNQSLGRAFNGNFVLSGIEAQITSPGAKPVKVNFTRAEADYSQKGYDVKLILDKDPNNGWAIDGNDPKKRLERKAMFVADKPVAVPANATLTVKLIHSGRFGGHNVGRFKLATTNDDPALVSLDGTGGPPEAVLAAMKTPTEVRTPKQRAELEKYFRSAVDSPLRDADYALAAAKGELEKAERAAAERHGHGGMPHPARCLHSQARRIRQARPSKVGMGLPAVLPPLPKGCAAQSPRPRQVARRSGQSAHGPRVGQSRVGEVLWLRLVQDHGEPRLAGRVPGASRVARLAGGGVHAQRLGHEGACRKLIVMSQTYRQQSKVTPELVAKDPDNRLLARGPRFRLAGEAGARSGARH